MEMERINDDTILVRIENEDLQERGTSVPELLANPGEIEEFFHSILVEMDVIDQFEDSEGMSFQVMPNPEGIEYQRDAVSRVFETINVRKYFGNVVTEELVELLLS